MNKRIQLSVLTLALACGVTAHAATSFQSFSAVANESFTKQFTVTPSSNNAVVITVSGMAAQFSAVSFAIAGGPTVAASVVNGNWVAAFNDGRNNDYSFSAMSPLSLTVTGLARTSVPGTDAVITIATRNGSIVSAVPEPETFAMLLAGLGLMGGIAVRRKKTSV